MTLWYTLCDALHLEFLSMNFMKTRFLPCSSWRRCSAFCPR